MSNDTNIRSIEPASNMARVMLAALAILMFVAIFYSDTFVDKIGRWIGDEPAQALERFDILVAWLAVLSLPLLAGGILTIRNGYRSVASERFPPAGMWVIFDTPIERGSRARLRGRLLQAGGALMCLVALGFPFALWYIMHSIADAG